MEGPPRRDTQLPLSRGPTFAASAEAFAEADPQSCAAARRHGGRGATILEEKWAGGTRLLPADGAAEDEFGNCGGWDAGAREAGKSPADRALDDSIVPLMAASAPCVYDQETDGKDEIEAVNEFGNYDVPLPVMKLSHRIVPLMAALAPCVYNQETDSKDESEAENEFGNNDVPLLVMKPSHRIVPLMATSAPCVYDQETDGEDEIEAENEFGNNDVPLLVMKLSHQAQTNDGKRPSGRSRSTTEDVSNGGREKKKSRCDDDALTVAASPPSAYDKGTDEGDKKEVRDEYGNHNLARHGAGCKSHPGVESQEDERRRKIDEIHEVIAAFITRRPEIMKRRSDTCPGNDEKDTKERRQLVLRIELCAASFLEEVIQKTVEISIFKCQSLPYRPHFGDEGR